MGMVTIGSKLPGSIWIELIKAADGRMPTPLDPDHVRVELKGANSLRVVAGEPSVSQFRFATTQVEETLWKEWLTRNKNLDFVRNGLVFEAKNEADAKAKAKERTDIRTGLEPLAQQNDPRLKATPGAPVHQRVEADMEHLGKLTSA